MNKEELNKYLSENLKIEIERSTRLGAVETLKVQLFLEGKLISYASCDLPEQ